MDRKILIVGLIIGIVLGFMVGAGSLGGTLAEKDAKIFQLNGEVSSASAQVSQLTIESNKVPGLQQQVTTLNSQVVALTSQKASMQTQINTLQAEVASLQTQLAAQGGGSSLTNLNPTASFTSTFSGLLASFTDSSTDDPGVVSWSWNFGDGSISTLRNPSHSYASSGTYQVVLTVKDAEGLSGTVTHGVTVSSPPPPSYDGPFVGSKNSDVYHYPSCSYAKQILASNLVTFNTSAEARAAGYRPCSRCNPP
jgi:PKD repeat protein